VTTFQVAGKAAALATVASKPAPARRAASLDVLGPVLEMILGQAEPYLDPPVGRAAIYPGLEVAWDDCCSGQLWVRLINVVPSGVGQQPGAVVGCKPLQWTALIGLGALRCAASVDDSGRAPSPATLTAEALQMSADRTALAEALQCAIAQYVSQLSFVRWDSLGPQGGCVGGEWLVQVNFDNCSCP
jgi:hypothetical protein